MLPLPTRAALLLGWCAHSAAFSLLSPPATTPATAPFPSLRLAFITSTSTSTRKGLWAHPSPQSGGDGDQAAGEGAGGQEELAFLSSPASLLYTVRSQRRAQTKALLDLSRDTLHIMFVDDDGCKARLLEGLTEKIAMWWDRAWWVNPLSSSVGRVRDGADADRRVIRIASKLALDKSRSCAPCCTLVRGDLDSYDMIVAVDAATRKQALRLLRGALSEADFAFYEAKVRLLSDFIDYGRCAWVPSLQPELAAIAAPHSAALSAAADVPHAYVKHATDAEHAHEYERMVAAFVLGCAGLVQFIMDLFEELDERRTAARKRYQS